MNDTLLGGLIAGGITLINLGYNYFAKRLELREQEKDRDFKIQEVFINKAVETLQEAQAWIHKMNSAIGEFKGNRMSKDNLLKFISDLEIWYTEKSLYMEKTVSEVFYGFIHYARTEVLGIEPPGSLMVTYSDILYINARVLQEALDKIAKQYNPLRDLDLNDIVKKRMEALAESYRRFNGKGESKINS